MITRYRKDGQLTLRNAQREYAEWRTQQGYAEATLRNDKAAFARLIKILGEDAPLASVTRDTCLSVLKTAGLTGQNSSVNTIHAGLGAMLKWARIMKYLPVDFDPLYGMRYLPQPKKEMSRLSLDQFPLLLDSAENPRDRMVIAAGLYLLLRTSEIENLRIRDVNLNEGTINVTIFKTGDFDVMPISSELDVELRRWLKTYQEQCGELKPNWYLTPARDRVLTGDDYKYKPEQPIGRTQRYIQRALKNMGLEDVYARVGIHMLRRSGARAWFDELNDQTVDGALKIVQAQLHHSSVVMTERYLGITADRTKRDRLLRGSSMFPSLAASNVIQLVREGPQ
jgi:integrase